MEFRIDEIEKRLKAATPGPWFPNKVHGESVEDANGKWLATFDSEPMDKSLDWSNAYLAAHAPADLAWAVARIRELEKALYGASGKLRAAAAILDSEANRADPEGLRSAAKDLRDTANAALALRVDAGEGEKP